LQWEDNVSDYSKYSMNSDEVHTYATERRIDAELKEIGDLVLEIKTILNKLETENANLREELRVAKVMLRALSMQGVRD
jgi:hypothetical protein